MPPTALKIMEEKEKVLPPQISGIMPPSVEPTMTPTKITLLDSIIFYP